MSENNLNDNHISQFRRGLLGYTILSLLAKKSLYTNELMQILKEADLEVIEGTIYPILNRYKNREFVEYEWVESKSGPPRKYYKLSEKGKVFLKNLSSDWQKLLKQIHTIENHNFEN